MDESETQMPYDNGLKYPNFQFEENSCCNKSSNISENIEKKWASIDYDYISDNSEDNSETEEKNEIKKVQVKKKVKMEKNTKKKNLKKTQKIEKNIW